MVFPGPLRERYEELQLLGSGAFGAVFRCRQISSGKEVAVKILVASNRRHAVQRFQREAESLARIRHPHVVRIYDFGEVGDSLYLVMELLEGSPLNLPQPGVDPRAAMFDAAQGLAAVHAEGLIHRDVKPANVMRRSDGRGVLIDLGLVFDPDRSRLTKTGALTGTLCYMAPEILTGAPASAATDWYAWGMTLFAACERRVPFSPDEMIQAMSRGQIPRLRFEVLKPESKTAALIEKMTSFRPEERLRSPEEIRQFLKEHRARRDDATLEIPVGESASPPASDLDSPSTRSEAPFGSSQPPSQDSFSVDESFAPEMRRMDAASTGPAKAPAPGPPGRGVEALWVLAGLVWVLLLIGWFSSSNSAPEAPPTPLEPTPGGTRAQALEPAVDVSLRWTVDLGETPVGLLSLDARRILAVLEKKTVILDAQDSSVLEETENPEGQEAVFAGEGAVVYRGPRQEDGWAEFLLLETHRSQTRSLGRYPLGRVVALHPKRSYALFEEADQDRFELFDLRQKKSLWKGDALAKGSWFFHPRDNLFYFWRDGLVHRIELLGGEPRTVLRLKEERPAWMLTQDARWLLAQGPERLLVLDAWKMNAAQGLLELEPKAQAASRFGTSRILKEDPQPRRIGVARQDGSSEVYASPGLSLYARTPPGEPLEEIAFLNQGRGVVCVRRGGQVDVYDYVAGIRSGP